MKQILISALLLSSAWAFASYDLVMVTDEVNHAVFRYDGSSGIYLGSFGSGTLFIPTGISADVSSGLAYVNSYGTNSIQVYEYSTGVLRNEFAVTSSNRGLARVGSNLYVAGGTGIFEYSTSGSLIRSFGSGTYTDVHIGSDGFVYTYSFTNSRYERFSQTGTASGTGTGLADGSGTPHWQGIGFAGKGFDTNAASDMIDVFSESSSMPSLYTIAVGGVLDSPTTIAMAHSPTAYAAGYVPGDAARSQIAAVSLLTGHVSSTPFGSGQLKRVRGMTTVVAPEPASLTFLALGAVALIRRRIRTS